MAGNGGKRTGAGRKHGVPNKATADIKALAQVHGPAVIKRLIYLAEHAESQQTQVAAGKELLDRGYGKSIQPIAGNAEGGALRVIIQSDEAKVL